MSTHYTLHMHGVFNEQVLTMIALSYKQVIDSYTGLEEVIEYAADKSNFLEILASISAPEYELVEKDGVKFLHMYWGDFTNDSGAFDTVIRILHYFVSCGANIYGVVYSKESVPFIDFTVSNFISAVSLHTDEKVKQVFYETVGNKFVAVGREESAMVKEGFFNHFDDKHRDYLNLEVRFWENINR